MADEARQQSKEEINFLESMVDLSPFEMPHSQSGQDAYHCDPCDGCGPDACYADGPSYELH
jgi:hypothetical protein